MERTNTPTNGLAACFVAAEPECGRSAQRKALFDIEVSTDGENFTKVFSGESCGTTADFETFSFTPVEARYVRYNGRGNSLSNWNNISEFRVLS